MGGLVAINNSLVLLLLILATWNDVKEMRIPNWLTGAAYTLRVPLFLIEWGIQEKTADTFGRAELWWKETIILEGMKLSGIVVLVIGLFLFSIISRHGLGFGDVKLLGAMALYLGVDQALTCLFCGLSLMAGICLALLRIGRIGWKNRLPLAPFLLMGHVGVILWKSCL